MSSLKIALIQADLQWENIGENLCYFENKIKEINGKAEVVFLPEMFTTGFSMNAETLAESMDGKSIAAVKNIAKENNIHIVGSLIIKENNQFFNRLIHVSNEGVLSAFYDKKHLFCLAKEQDFYSAGNERIFITINGVKICPMICYDLRFPVWARNDKQLPYDVLVYVANWPAKRDYAWQQLLVARAIENVCYVIGVNRVGEDANRNSYCGNSMVLNPLGERALEAEGNMGVFYFTIEKYEIDNIRKQFPFLKDADDFDIKK